MRITKFNPYRIKREKGFEVFDATCYSHTSLSPLFDACTTALRSSSLSPALVIVNPPHAHHHRQHHHIIRIKAVVAAAFF